MEASSEAVGAVRAHIGVDMLGEDQANHFKFRRRRLGLSFFPLVCLLVCFGRCIHDVVDQLIRTDKDRYAESESLPSKHVNGNVGGSRRPQADTS